MRDSMQPVVDGVDLLLAELRLLKSRGPQLRIVHRFREPGMVCATGEEIAVAYLVHRSKFYPLRLSLALRMLIDYFAKHPHFPQSGTRMPRTSPRVRTRPSTAVPTTRDAEPHGQHSALRPRLLPRAGGHSPSHVRARRRRHHHRGH